MFLFCPALSPTSNLHFLMSLVQEPFNAEPPRSALISSYVTPVDFFYKRNHGPIPVVDDIERLHFLFEFLLSTYKTFKVFDVKQC